MEFYTYVNIFETKGLEYLLLLSFLALFILLVALVIVAIVTAPLLPILTAALLALETSRRGAVQGLTSAGFGVAGLASLAALSRTGVVAFALTLPESWMLPPLATV